METGAKGHKEAVGESRVQAALEFYCTHGVTATKHLGKEGSSGACGRGDPKPDTPAAAAYKWYREAKQDRRSGS